jgi:SAM-dependent methyltransferase
MSDMEKRMTKSLAATVRHKAYAHRSRWTARKLAPFIKATDRVLDIGAGDCRLAVRLHERIGCEVVAVDVEDFNTTDLPVILFDGKRLPFADHSFDVVLLVFVLHHAEDAAATLEEACRVSRSQVIVFEDAISCFRDRLTFRLFHRWLAWSEKISYPFREWRPSQWTEFAAGCGMRQHFSGIVGRQLFFSCRHVLFVWEKIAATMAQT